jgi:hypothetical protein
VVLPRMAEFKLKPFYRSFKQLSSLDFTVRSLAHNIAGALFCETLEALSPLKSLKINGLATALMFTNLFCESACLIDITLDFQRTDSNSRFATYIFTKLAAYLRLNTCKRLSMSRLNFKSIRPY